MIWMPLLHLLLVVIAIRWLVKLLLLVVSLILLWPSHLLLLLLLHTHIGAWLGKVVVRSDPTSHERRVMTLLTELLWSLTTHVLLI